MKIITHSMVQNAVKLLGTAPDGTQANNQARNKAIVVLLAHVGNLERFAARKPHGRVDAALAPIIAKYKEITK